MKKETLTNRSGRTGSARTIGKAALNDPFECAVTTVYVFPDEAEENREIAKVLTEINGSKPVTEEDVHRARRETREPVYASIVHRAGFDKVRYRLVYYGSSPPADVVSLHHRWIRLRHRLRCCGAQQTCRPCGMPAKRDIQRPAIPDYGADRLSFTGFQSSKTPVLQKWPLVLRGRMAPDSRAEQDHRHRRNGPTRSTHKSGSGAKRGSRKRVLY